MQDGSWVQQDAAGRSEGERFVPTVSSCGSAKAESTVFERVEVLETESTWRLSTQPCKTSKHSEALESSRKRNKMRNEGYTILATAVATHWIGIELDSRMIYLLERYL